MITPFAHTVYQEFSLFSTMSDQQRARFAAVSAGLFAASIPLLLIGRAALSVTLLLALLAALPALNPREFKAHAGRLMQRPFAIWITLILVFWAVSLPASIDPNASVSTWWVAAGVALAALLFRTLFATGAMTLDVGLKTLLVGMSVTCALMAYAYTMGWEVISFVKGRGWQFMEPSLGVDKPLSNAFMLALPVILVAGWRLGGGWRLAAIAQTLFILILADISETRAAMAGAAAGGLVVALMAGGRLRGWLSRLLPVVLALGVVGMAVLVAMHNSKRDEVGERDVYLPIQILDYHRQQIWKFSWEAGWNQPVFGNGLNALSKIEGAKQIVPGTEVELIPGHPHNWMVEVFAETGLIGFLPLLGTVICFGLSLIRRYGHRPNAGLMAAGGVFGIYWGSGLFNFSFWAPWWMATHMICLMMCLAIWDAERVGTE